MTGLITLLGAHTRFLDEFLADAGRAGLRQVVIVGSGLDTRPYRLWWPPGTTVYEIDQPDVIDFKTAVLRGLGAELTAHRRAVGVDLRHDWLTAMRRAGFDAAQPTAWIAETFLIGFLPPTARTGCSKTSRRSVRRAAVRRRPPAQLVLISAGGRPDVRQHLAAIRSRRGSGGADVSRPISCCPAVSGRSWLADRRTKCRRFVQCDWNEDPLARHPDDDAITPRYVTATRSAGPAATPGRNASA